MDNQIHMLDFCDEESVERLGGKEIISTDWKWSLKDYPQKNGLKVFSCFACGGGSTMGYKLSGCEVIGCCEIDKRMNDVYIKNHNPKYNYLMDIREFNKLNNLPEELYNLDILDGSPPCSTFSMAGEREKGWGVEKKFAEGQKVQTLDDLLFVFIDTVEKLQPKVAIMENVEGLVMGAAYEYVIEIYKRFKEIGYKVNHWLLKGENMGVPQTRHRVFFVATKIDIDLVNINMTFNYKKITYGEIKSERGIKVVAKKTLKLLENIKNDEKSFEAAHKRLCGKVGRFNDKIIDDWEIMPTIRSRIDDKFRRDRKENISIADVVHSQTFPQDFDFMPNSANKVGYICGMSVPPIMIKRLMGKLIESGLFDYKLREKL